MASTDLELIFKALAFAANKHRHQQRKDVDASPYINHSIAVADVLLKEGKITDSEVLCAALLHDTLEGSDTSIEEIEAHFGPGIAAIVGEVSTDRTLPKEARAQAEHILRASEPALLIMLADKICDLRDVGLNLPSDWPLERRRQYFISAKEALAAASGTNPTLEAAFQDAYEHGMNLLSRSEATFVPTSKIDRDAYDYMDCRPLGRDTGIATPEYLARLISDRKNSEAPE